MKMSSNDKENNDTVSESTSFENGFENNSVNSIEIVRRCAQPLQDFIQTSWEQSYVSFDQSEDRQFVTAMVIDANSSTQTDASRSDKDVSLSFSKDFTQDSSSNGNSEHYLGDKRYRCESIGDKKELRPWKKSKCDSCSSSHSELNEPKHSRGPSTSSRLSSSSETSFKSISTNCSLKVRKRRLKSDSNLFRDALQRARKNTNLTHNESEHNTSGGTPRKDRSHRQAAKVKSWRIMDLCTWIGKKSYQSITSIYTDLLKEPITDKDYDNPLQDELKLTRKMIEEANKRQQKMEWENQMMREDMMKMRDRINELEGSVRNQETTSIPHPPPPPPPPPAPLASKKLPVRSHTIPRCGPAPPRPTITPLDIANVKLRKTKDNPVRKKPTPEDQPLVTLQMLQTTRAKLRRARPVASSTPKKQLTELEKFFKNRQVQLFRRRVANSFRSTEELRMRPYPSTKGPRSPQSPRSSSLPRRTPISPLKLPTVSKIIDEE